MAAVPPVLAADSWVYNPNDINFNPGTKVGQDIFENKKKGLKEENRLTATKEDSQSIRLFLENKSPTLGKVVTQIPIIYDADGDPTKWGNLLFEYVSISMNLFQRKAHKRFIKPVDTFYPLPADQFTVTTLDPSNFKDDKKLFYSRVYSQVVAELIKNILTEAEYSKLMLKKNMFNFHDDTTGNERIDGPCLLKLFFDIINPNVVVGVKVLLQKLEATKLHLYQNNVDDILTDMEEYYSKIVNNKITCESIRLYMLNALLSGPNPKFGAFIEQIRYGIDSGIGLNNHMLHDDLTTAARAKYNKMVDSNKYYKLDPKDAKIIALTTKVTALERFVSANSANVTSCGRSSGGYRGCHICQICTDGSLESSEFCR